MIDKFGEDRPPIMGAGSPASRQVHWHSTFEFAEKFAARHGLVIDHTLIAGTVRWCDLPDDDAQKLLALILGGVRDAIGNDAAQEVLVQASHEIAAMPDWRPLNRGSVYIPRQPKEVA